MENVGLSSLQMGVEFDTTVYRPASFIESTIDNLTRTLLVGAVIVVVALLALMWGVRSALISFAAIALSLVAAALVLNVRGSTMNTMVLAGLAVALGAVIDDDGTMMTVTLAGRTWDDRELLSHTFTVDGEEEADAWR